MSLNAHLLVLFLATQIPVLLSLHHVAKHDLDDSERELTRTKRQTNQDDKVARKLSRWPRDRVFDIRSAENKTANKLFGRHQMRPYAKEQAQDIKVQIKLKQTWRSKMADKTSSEFKLLDGNVVDAVANELDSDRNFIEVRVLNFSSADGYVLANIGVIFFKTEDDPVGHLEAVVATGWISGMPVFHDFFKLLQVRNGNSKGQGWVLPGRGMLHLVPVQTTPPASRISTTEQRKMPKPKPLKYKEVKVAFKLRQVWHPFLNDKSATSYVVLSGNIEQAVDRAFVEYMNYIDTTTLGFSESTEHHVVVYVSVRFKNEEEHPVEVLRKLITGGSLSGMPLHTGYFVLLAENDVIKDTQQQEGPQQPELPKMPGKQFDEYLKQAGNEEEKAESQPGVKPLETAKQLPAAPTTKSQGPDTQQSGQPNVTFHSMPKSEEEEFENQKPKTHQKPGASSQEHQGTVGQEETKPSEAGASGKEEKPAEEKQEETKPSETKPSETKPSETKPSETKPEDTSQTKSNNTLQAVLKQGLDALGRLFGLGSKSTNTTKEEAETKGNETASFKHTKEAQTSFAVPPYSFSDKNNSAETHASGRLPGNETTTSNSFGIIGPNDQEVQAVAESLERAKPQSKYLAPNDSSGPSLAVAGIPPTVPLKESSAEVTVDYSAPNATEEVYQSHYQGPNKVEKPPSLLTLAKGSEQVSIQQQGTLNEAKQPTEPSSQAERIKVAPASVSPKGSTFAPSPLAPPSLVSPETNQEQLPSVSYVPPSNVNISLDTASTENVPGINGSKQFPPYYPDTSPYPVPLPPEGKNTDTNDLAKQRKPSVEAQSMAGLTHDNTTAHGTATGAESWPPSSAFGLPKYPYPVQAPTEGAAVRTDFAENQESKPIPESVTFNGTAESALVPTPSIPIPQDTNRLVKGPPASYQSSQPLAPYSQETVPSAADTTSPQNSSGNQNISGVATAGGNSDQGMPNYSNLPSSQYPQTDEQPYGYGTYPALPPPVPAVQPPVPVIPPPVPAVPPPPPLIPAPAPQPPSDQYQSPPPSYPEVPSPPAAQPAPSPAVSSAPYPSPPSNPYSLPYPPAAVPTQVNVPPTAPPLPPPQPPSSIPPPPPLSPPYDVTGADTSSTSNSSEASQLGQTKYPEWPDTYRQSTTDNNNTANPTPLPLVPGTKEPATLPTDWEHEIRGTLKLQQVWIPELGIPQSAPYRTLENSVVNSLRDVYAKFAIDVAPLLLGFSEDFDRTNANPESNHMVKVAFRILFAPGHTASPSPLESAVWSGDVSGLLVFKDSLDLQGPYGTVSPSLSGANESIGPTMNPFDAAKVSTTPQIPEPDLLTLPSGMPKSCQEIRDAGIGNLDGQYIIEARPGCHLSIICQNMDSTAPREFMGGPNQDQYDYWHYAVLIKVSSHDKESMPDGACLERTETGRDLIARIIKAGTKQGNPIASWGTSIKRMLIGRRKRALDKKDVTIMTRPIKIMKESKQRKVRSSLASWGVL